jgi:uncharacterized phage protein gp47/JayE
MPKTAQEYSQQIRAQLKILDPTLSADPLTPERKIIDTVAEVLAGASIDSYTLTYQFDVDTKAGSDLDKFLATFGFARQGGRRATGSVTFSRTTPPANDILISSGTQVVKPATNVSPAVVFFTTTSVVLPTGGTSVEAPIEAADVGSLYNVPANTITQISGFGGSDISAIFNATGTTGGVESETDAEVRVRFKNTVLRNIAGTKDQYLALSIASRFSNKANVIGPISRFSEYAQVPSTGTIISQIPYSNYTYNYDYYLTNGDVTNEIFYVPRGADYTFTDTVPPTVAVNSASTTLTSGVTLPAATIPVTSTAAFPSSGKILIGGQVITYTGKTGVTFTGATGGVGTFGVSTPVFFGTIRTGDVVLLEHSYCSINSRNDPFANLTNYVDIYVSGSNATEASDSLIFPTSAQNITATTSSAYYTQRFTRADGSYPVIGNRFMELLWQPIITIPSSIIINGTPYFQGTDYWQVTDTTNYRGSRRSRDGIEWSATAATSIGVGTPLVVDYTFDLLPMTLNEIIDDHKQITTDVLVHSATERFLNINLIVMYLGGFSKSSVDTAIETALENFLERQYFGAVIQLSDIVEVVHEVPGVDNVRIATSSDGVSYGVQEVGSDGVSPIGLPHTTDFFLQDSDLPVLNSVNAYQRSQNTW